MALAGCTSDTAGTPASVSVPASSSAPASLCPDATTDPTLTSCLSDAIATFWSGQLNDAVSEPVVLHPSVAQVPQPCRPGLRIAPAFTCPGNRTLYFTDAFVAKLDASFPGAARSYAFAVVQSHEMGHIVQLQVHQPQMDERGRSKTATRFVEQQADCLSGVWAHAATSSMSLDPAEFRAVADRVLASISTAQEIETHGTPQQRLAAIDRGLDGGRPQSCQLASFH